MALTKNAAVNNSVSVPGRTDVLPFLVAIVSLRPFWWAGSFEKDILDFQKPPIRTVIAHALGWGGGQRWTKEAPAPAPPGRTPPLSGEQFGNT